VQRKVPNTAAEWAAAHAELATENEALATQLAQETKDKKALATQLAAETKDKEALATQLTQETKDKEALAAQLAATTKQLAAETKGKEALARQLAETVSQCANPPAHAAAAGAEGSQPASTPARVSPRSCRRGRPPHAHNAPLLPTGRRVPLLRVGCDERCAATIAHAGVAEARGRALLQQAGPRRNRPEACVAT
jgi:hypothetical protein